MSETWLDNPYRRWALGLTAGTLAAVLAGLAGGAVL